MVAENFLVDNWLELCDWLCHRTHHTKKRVMSIKTGALALATLGIATECLVIDLCNAVFCHTFHIQTKNNRMFVNVTLAVVCSFSAKLK